MALDFRNPESPAFRYFLLGWNVLVGLGTTFCTDLPSIVVFMCSPLQARFTGTSEACKRQNGSSSGVFTKDCFDATYDEYNSLYASYAWANAAFTVFGGIISDKMGCHSSILVWCGMHVLGSMCFAFGSLQLFTSFRMQLVIMNIGRVLLGVANGSIQTNQSQFNTFWFHAHALSLAFGIKVFIARIGSTLNFFLTTNLVNLIGFSWTLIFGACMSLVSFFAAVVVSRLHLYGIRELGVVDDVLMANKLFRLRHLKSFSFSFYTLAAMLGLFYCGIFGYISDSTEFLQHRYGISEHAASYITSAIYSFSLFNPLVSLLVDRWGQRAWWLLFSCVLSSLGYMLIWIAPMVPPLLFISFLAVGYTCFASNVWASVPLLVPFELSGSAFGIAGSMQMFFVGICNISVGRILETSGGGDAKWQNMLYFLGSTALCSLLLAVILVIVDRRSGQRLKPTQAELQQSLLAAASISDINDNGQSQSGGAYISQFADDIEDDLMPVADYTDQQHLVVPADTDRRRSSWLETLPPPIAAHSAVLAVLASEDAAGSLRRASVIVSPVGSMLAEFQHNVPN